MDLLNREEKPFVPNPKSKTPLTDEMMFNARKIIKKDENGRGSWDAEKFVESFTVPSEKEDIIAMYLACKTNGWHDKEKAIAKQMQILFKDDRDVKKILGIFELNPNSKTPLTDELMFNVKKLREEGKFESSIEKYIGSFTIPSEKKDIIAMYLACKTNEWQDKENAIAEQMQILFKDDRDVKKVLGIFVPNPKSKTPLTDELVFNVEKFRKERKWSRSEEYIGSFTIPSEKEDIIAMYLACKTSKVKHFDDTWGVDEWEKKQNAIATQMQILFKDDPDIKSILKADKLWVEKKPEPKQFAPNPDSKTPLTDEMLFNVRRLQKKKASNYDIEEVVAKFSVPTEKQDLLAMYLACKTNGWGKKKKALTMQMKVLFKNDPDIKEIVVEEEKNAVEAAEARKIDKEKARIRKEKKKAEEKRDVMIAIVFAVSLLAISGLIILLIS